MQVSPLPTRDAVLALPSTVGLGALSDDDLRARQSAFAAVRRRVDAGAALVAAELHRRSTRDAGHGGLAQRQAEKSAERLIEKLAGVTPAEAHAMVRVGELMQAAESPIGDAVRGGELSVMAADAISLGLGQANNDVTTSMLDDAAAFMISVAPELPVRRVAGEARAIRDVLDAAGVAEREEVLRQRRYLRLTRLDDGSVKLSALLDPESAAIVVAALDPITAPRAGGPRFIDSAAQARSQAIIDDPRSTGQLLADALVELLRIACAADQNRVYSQRKPAVTIHVALSDLRCGVGTAHFDGQSASVSPQTADRWACAAGAVTVLFDGEDAINLGRAQRLFSDRQKLVLAARDGGCRFPGCDAPASWTEAHHADEWSDGGATDVDNGILLCRFHHLWTHNHGWHVSRRGSTFVATAPDGRELEMRPATP